ncbi:MAG: alkaline phosphatase family protein [Chthoniobacterales bacterium]
MAENVYSKTARVLLIGWESAEWKIIEPLVEAGELPHLTRLIENGAMGRLATLDPPLPPLTWTSIATGKAPQDHGVLGLEEPAENGIDVQPFSSKSRRCEAIWNILSESGKACHVVGWPATSPAENINGVMISSGWDTPIGERDVPWELPPSLVSPRGFTSTASELRMHPGELSVNDLVPFIPSLQTVDASNEPAILHLSQAVAIAASRQAAATYLMENEPWDFLAVYFPSLDEIVRHFIEFHPPQMKHLSEERFEKFRNVVAEAYRFHDQMLGRLIELAGPRTNLILCSASGVHTETSRAVPERGKAISYVGPHRAAGIFFLGGPGVCPDELIYGATLYDIAPTVLTLFGSGVPKEMIGRPLAEAFVEPIQPTQRTSSSKTPQSPSVKLQPKRLRDGSPSPAMLAALENDFNLARCFQASGRHDLALPLLETMHRERPLRISPALHLIHCYRALGQTARAAETLEHFAKRLEIDQESRPAAFLPDFNLMRGLLELDRGNAEAALAHLQKAESAAAQLPNLQIHLGEVYTRLRQPRKAEEAFRRALEIDPENTEAAAGLSGALYRQRKYEEAADMALLAAAHAPSSGRNHLQLGRCLARLNRNEDALLAIGNALRRQPALIEAHRIAIVLHRRAGTDMTAAEWHKQAVTKLLSLRKHAWKLLAEQRNKLAPKAQL